MRLNCMDRMREFGRRYPQKRQMAHFETVKTGDKIETRIRGRSFRFAPQRAKAKGLERPPASRERRRVCVLDSHNGRMLECWGVDQPCFGPRCTHRHHTRDEVDKLVKDGILKYVAGSQRNVAVYTYARTWKGMPSGPGGKLAFKCMQLV